MTSCGGESRGTRDTHYTRSARPEYAEKSPLVHLTRQVNAVVWVLVILEALSHSAACCLEMSALKPVAEVKRDLRRLWRVN